LNKRLLIIGAGGFGREILAWAEDVQRAGTADWSVFGFLDANQQALDGFDIDQPIVGDPATYQPSAGDCFVCAIGDPKIKLDVCRALQERGANFINLIHPTAIIGPRCILGTGTILCPFAAITVDAMLGDFVTLNLRAGVGHDVIVGHGCTLNAFCDVTGGAKLGDGVFLGSHAVIAPRVHVGEFAKVGAGSVVVRRIKDYASVMGVPAKRIGFPSSQGSKPRAA
jgi:sugar O-acyltransferase (sialic acid O-acetyltransferase NeuD family)